MYAESPVSWTALWSGSVEHEKNMINRSEFRLIMPLDLSLRVQVIDRRPTLFWNDLDAGTTALSGGISHRGTGSRLLHGLLDEWGLPARIRSPWIKSVPFVEYHRPTVYDLKTEPSSTKTAESYLCIGSPQITLAGIPFQGFAGAVFDSSFNPAINAGLNAVFSTKTSLHLEGFYTGWTLPAKKASAWFSSTPPLPERDFYVYAFSAVFSSPYYAIAADWAYSDTFAFGQDSYTNLGVRIGSRPWLVSLAADGAGPQYVGRDGNATGAGFRSAVRLEHYGRYSELFRVSTSLRAPQLWQPFERSTSQIYYHFPVRVTSFPVQLSRISVEANRNASDLAKVHDSYYVSIGLTGGVVRFAFTGTLNGLTAVDTAPAPFPVFDIPFVFDSAKVSGEASYTWNVFQFKAGLAYTAYREKEPAWEPSLSVSARIKPGRISIALKAEPFPDAFSYTVSWRLEKK